MSGKAKIQIYKTLPKLAIRLRDDLNASDFVLLYAFNGTGKTRLSIEFKNRGKKGEERDTLYFNAFTEDLFSWDNDLENDTERKLRINSSSRFFAGFRELALEEKIFSFLERYAEFDFRIDYENWTVSFSKGEHTNIKVSRGEETMFIWCVFLAICQLTLDGAEAYKDIKYIYIDDPISSLDDNNAIAVASDLCKLLQKASGRLKTVISSHHALFFNVLCNELKKRKPARYFLHRTAQGYGLQGTEDTPFFHHVASLSELRQVAAAGNINTYHFNVLRAVLEKTATFFGYKDFSDCIHGVDDETLYARALNLLSHGQYSVYAPVEMTPDNKKLFQNILAAFLAKYQFDLPAL
ncbi:AAA family ATPase [Hymenobacter sp. BT664]|uniref:AAA family ATPase n=1 Tax=Hymenobacter montanus TaxID=2771359 RepID=A0A927BGS1_9BACT|nr:AAA family ATPase [Hymenobacter montanus]MBD2769773.1 AAA family ATPase [Hymenobacter montanus]